MPQESSVPPVNALDNEVSSFEHGSAAPPASSNEIVVTSASTEVKPAAESTPPVVAAKPEDKSEATTPETKKTPLEPPKIDDYSKILENGKVSFAKPKAAEDKKPDVKNTTEEGKTVGTPEDDKTGKPERDLEGFSEREALWLRRMPIDAYEYFSKELRERKLEKEITKTALVEKEAKIKQLEVGKQVLPESYYENPQAFVLAPEFQTLQANLNTAQQVQQHWEEQLAKVQAGEDWNDLINDPKTGQIVYGQVVKFKGDGRDNIELMKHMNGAQAQVASLHGKMEQFAEGFQTQHKQVRTRISEAEKTMFPTFDNKESEEYKTTEALKPELKKWGVREDNPAFNLLARAVATGIMFRNIIVELQSKQTVKEEVKKDQVKAGPTNNNFGGGGATQINKTKEPPKIDDYEKILSGRY